MTGRPSDPVSRPGGGLINLPEVRILDYDPDTNTTTCERYAYDPRTGDYVNVSDHGGRLPEKIPEGDG